jgi:hypothetical protein
MSPTPQPPQCRPRHPTPTSPTSTATPAASLNSDRHRPRPHPPTASSPTRRVATHRLAHPPLHPHPPAASSPTRRILTHPPRRHAPAASSRTTSAPVATAGRVVHPPPLPQQHAPGYLAREGEWGQQGRGGRSGISNQGVSGWASAFARPYLFYYSIVYMYVATITMCETRRIPAAGHIPINPP